VYKRVLQNRHCYVVLFCLGFALSAFSAPAGEPDCAKEVEHALRGVGSDPTLVPAKVIEAEMQDAVPFDQAVEEVAREQGMAPKKVRSLLEKTPLFGPLFTKARARLVARPGLLSKILKDQIATPLGLFIVNPHDPDFYLKWTTLAPSRLYLVIANAGHAGETGAGIKNVFDRGATLSEKARFLIKKCALQGAVGIATGAAAKTVEEAIRHDGTQTLTDEGRDILIHAASTGAYFFLTACIRYQALDKLNQKVPQWLSDLGAPEALRDKGSVMLLTGMYFGNAALSAVIYGKVTQAEGLVRNALPGSTPAR
jgi:hypothetical protein